MHESMLQSHHTKIPRFAPGSTNLNTSAPQQADTAINFYSMHAQDIHARATRLAYRGVPRPATHCNMNVKNPVMYRVALVHYVTAKGICFL